MYPYVRRSRLPYLESSGLKEPSSCSLVVRFASNVVIDGGIWERKPSVELLMLHDRSCLFVIRHNRPSGWHASTENLALHTIDEHLHIAVDAACNLQHFCRRHPCLFLSKFVQPFQSILNVVPS